MPQYAALYWPAIWCIEASWAEESLPSHPDRPHGSFLAITVLFPKMLHSKHTTSGQSSIVRLIGPLLSCSLDCCELTRYGPSIHAPSTPIADSDVLFFETFGTKWIVLNSLESATELLEKRGSNYADRPRFVMFEEYVSLSRTRPPPLRRDHDRS